ncbi:MAG: hypothetical protein ACRDDZ_07420 [Marinifilaceae bacterium]
MKKIVLSLVTLMLVFLSCNKDDDYMIWDIGPIEYYIYIEDSEGRDMLNPAYGEGFEVGSLIITYDNVDYKCSNGVSISPSKVYLPVFSGLSLREREGRFYLNFGELEGAKSYKDETLTIKWPDGRVDKVSFTRSYKVKKNWEPIITHVWYLNGEEVTQDKILIVK